MKLFILIVFVVTLKTVSSQGTSFLASRLLGFSPGGFRYVKLKFFCSSIKSNYIKHLYRELKTVTFLELVQILILRDDS